MGNDSLDKGGSYGDDWAVEDEELGTTPSYIPNPKTFDRRKLAIIGGAIVAVLLLVALGFLFFLFFIHDGGESSDEVGLKYGIVVDLGSSGSRVNIFCWNSSTPVQPAPLGSTAWYMEVRPGISSFANNISAIDAYLTPLMSYASSNLLSVNATLSTTPIFLLATAGMRLLPASSQKAIFDEVQTFIDDDTEFLFEDSWAEIISGTQEAVFDWLSVQQILLLNSVVGSNTMGVIDEGGASIEVAFVPTNFDGDDDDDGFITEVDFNGDSYQLYAVSYLNYGKNQALLNVDGIIINNSSSSSSTLDNPCMLVGDSRTSSYNSSITFNGTGNFTLCQQYVSQFIGATGEPNTAINGTFQPPLVTSNQFYGLDYIDSVASFFDVVDGFTPQLLESATQSFCALTISQARQQNPNFVQDGIPLGEFCFQGIYSQLFLQTVGIQYDVPQLLPIETLFGDEVSWALGAMIFEIQANDL